MRSTRPQSSASGPDWRLVAHQTIEPHAVELLGANGIKTIDSERTPLRAEEGCDFSGPAPRKLNGPTTRDEVVPGHGIANLVDRCVTDGEMFASLELEQNDVALNRDKHVPTRIVEGIHLHVRRAGGVSDVDRIIEKTRITPGVLDCPTKAQKTTSFEIRSGTLTE